MQGELEHRVGKRFYTRTNKVNAAGQIAHHVYRGQRLRHIAARADKKTQQRAQAVDPAHLGPAETSSRGRGSLQKQRKLNNQTGAPQERFIIADSEQEYCDITEWVSRSPPGDPAFQVSSSLLICLFSNG